MHLNLENQCLTDEKLLQVLRKTNGIEVESLNLQNNNLTQQSLNTIGYWLYASSRQTNKPIVLKELCLSGNLDLFLKGDAAKSCVQMLRQCSNLTSLSLGNTSLDSASFQYIAKYLLEYNPSLQYLNVSGVHNTIEFCHEQSTLQKIQEKLHSFILANRTASALSTS